jgi:hypothetical protein
MIGLDISHVVTLQQVCFRGLGLPGGFWLPSADRSGSMLEPQWATTGSGRETQFYDSKRPVSETSQCPPAQRFKRTGDRGSVPEVSERRRAKLRAAKPSAARRPGK